MSKKPPFNITDTQISRVELARMISSVIGNNFTQSRDALINRFGSQCRDIDKECGYPVGFVDALYFKHTFKRISVANRVVRVRADQCWSEPPELYEKEGSEETFFESEWKAFMKEHNPWVILHDLDVVSGIGRFGVLLIGLNDGRRLDEPVAGFDEKGERTVGRPSAKMKVTFMRCFDETQVSICELEEDETSPRFKQPLYYDICFDSVLDREDAIAQVMDPESDGLQWTKVHWTRIIHFHDNALTSPNYGCPRQEPVLNDILDYKKVKGGSSEGMWTGGFPGLVIETQAGKEDYEFDKDGVDEAIRKYINQLSRGLALENMTAKTLQPNIASPEPNVRVLIESICAGIDVPIVIFLGAMAGQLASEMTLQQWNRTLSGRQKMLLIPKLIKELTHRLIKFGVLPKPKTLLINWSDFETITEAQRADVSLKRTQALLQYVTSGAEKVMPLRVFLSRIMYFTDSETEAMIEEVKNNKTFYTKELWSQTAGLTPSSSGTKPTAKTGTSGNRNANGPPKPKK